MRSLILEYFQNAVNVYRYHIRNKLNLTKKHSREHTRFVPNREARKGLGEQFGEMRDLGQRGLDIVLPFLYENLGKEMSNADRLYATIQFFPGGVSSHGP